MANIILPILLQNYMTNLLKDQPDLLFGVRNQVGSLQKELKNIIDDILTNQEVAKHNSNDIKKVVDKVKEVAIEVEDDIDSYLAPKVLSKKHTMGNPLGRLYHFLRHVKLLRDALNKTRRIAKDIRNHINEEATNNIGTGEAESSAAAAQVNQSLQRSRDSVEEDNVVGFDHYTTSLVNQLIDLDNLQRNVISMIGMGGVGKTTLARKIYNDTRINDHFDCVVWVYVSLGYNRKRFFLELLERFDLNYYYLSDEDLIARVSDHLRGKRYFIIMDEIWQTQVWEEVRDAFPDESKGSRILITSRDNKIATHASTGTPPVSLSFLDNDASWELFCTNTELKFLKEENCSSNLKNLAKQFVEGCKGLPLSIIDLGEILAKQGKSYRTWSNFWFDVVDGYDKRTSDWSLGFVALSYNHLRDCLKPCFLYLGVFPENYEIQAKLLTQLWVAEGFLKQTKDAEDCLKELIDQSLIQVARKRSNGSVKTCRIHSLTRDFCMIESLQEKFLEVQSEDNLASRSSKSQTRRLQKNDHNFPSQSKPRILTRSSQQKNLEVNQSENNDHDLSSRSKPARRISIHYKSLSYHTTWNRQDTSSSSARSVLYFCQNQVEFDQNKWAPLLQSLKFIRVLSFFNINIEGGLDLSGIENLVFLKCFKISGTGFVNKLPDSMCNLRFLEILEFEINMGPFLWETINIWRMKQLRCLCSQPMKLRKPDGNTLCNLQVLSELYVDGETADFITNSKLPSLTDLGLYYNCSDRLNESDMANVLVSVEKLQNLRRLSIFGFIKCEPQRLAPTLTKVRLYQTSVDPNLLSVLGKLPELQALTIKIKSMYCEYNEITVEAGKFPRLQVFKMIGFDIKKWEMESNAMPKLQHLVIIGNHRMQALPDQLWSSEALRLVHMSDISKSLSNSLRKFESEGSSTGERRRREAPWLPQSQRYLQGKVLELYMKNGCKLFIGEKYDFRNFRFS